MAPSLQLKISIVFAMMVLLFSDYSAAQTRCLTNELHQKKWKEDANYRSRFSQNELPPAQLKFPQTSMVDTTITIPVVVHVLFNNQDQNISEEEIQSQIDILNEDFAANNASSTDIPSVWTGLVQDSKIRFKLAQRDPSGNRSNGIVRVATVPEEFLLFDPAIYSSALGGSDAWPRASYLNIWVCKLQGNALGYANFPGSNASQDGVVINYLAFGRNGIARAPYNFGRTSTHEIGHWLILSHIWGDDNNDCSASDFPITQQQIDDTPNQQQPTFRCKKFPALDDCSPTTPGIMYMNFMDYTDDKCMMFFTPGQQFRMRTTLNGVRDSLKISSGHVLPSLYAHDVAIDSVLNPVRVATNRCLEPVVRLRNNGSDTIYAASIVYGMPAGLSKTFQWSGTLLPGASTIVTLPEIGTNVGTQVMEFRLSASDDVSVNDYISAGFKVNNSSNSNCTVSNLLAFPNPVTSQQGLCVRSGHAESQLSVISVFNAIGQLMSERKILVNPGDAIPVNLTGFQAGVYFLRIEGDIFSESVRFIYLPMEMSTDGPVNCN